MGARPATASDSAAAAEGWRHMRASVQETLCPFGVGAECRSTQQAGVGNTEGDIPELL